VPNHECYTSNYQCGICSVLTVQQWYIAHVDFTLCLHSTVQQAVLTLYCTYCRALCEVFAAKLYLNILAPMSIFWSLLDFYFWSFIFD